MTSLRILSCAVRLLAALPSFAQATPATATPDFQVVESVPVATNYGEPGVPRTQKECALS